MDDQFFQEINNSDFNIILEQEFKKNSSNQQPNSNQNKVIQNQNNIPISFSGQGLLPDEIFFKSSTKAAEQPEIQNDILQIMSNFMPNNVNDTQPMFMDSNNLSSSNFMRMIPKNTLTDTDNQMFGNDSDNYYNQSDTALNNPTSHLMFNYSDTNNHQTFNPSFFPTNLMTNTEMIDNHCITFNQKDRLPSPKQLADILRKLEIQKERLLYLKSRHDNSEEGKKEKNKISSRICRLNKNRITEINKIKIYHLVLEFKGLLCVTSELGNFMLSNGGNVHEPGFYTNYYNNLRKKFLLDKPVAGKLDDLIKDCLSTIINGFPNFTYTRENNLDI